VTTVRATVHVHSDWSYDGSWRLDDLARAFGRRGYDVVLTAEHDRGFDEARFAAYRAACAAASTSDVLVVPGMEYSDAADAVHVPVWGELPFLGAARDTGELLRDVHKLDGVAVLAHPARKDAWRRFEPSWAAALLGLELWNRKYDGWAPNGHARELLASSAGLLPFVALDFHRARQFFPLAMLIDVDGPLSESRVVEALRARRCRPEAFGISAMHLTSGGGARAAHGAERARRFVARGLRAAERSRR
jgi:hypothetical protein